jgi:hypothetical protein
LHHAASLLHSSAGVRPRGESSCMFPPLGHTGLDLSSPDRRIPAQIVYLGIQRTREVGVLWVKKWGGARTWQVKGYDACHLDHCGPFHDALGSSVQCLPLNDLQRGRELGC